MFSYLANLPPDYFIVKLFLLNCLCYHSRIIAVTSILFAMVIRILQREQGVFNASEGKLYLMAAKLHLPCHLYRFGFIVLSSSPRVHIHQNYGLQSSFTHSSVCIKRYVLGKLLILYNPLDRNKSSCFPMLFATHGIREGE